jgi:RND family efflux transporter MFP subunit
MGPIADIRQLSGTLKATSDFTVSAKVAGRIASFEADLGSAVERSGLLGQIDPEPFALQVQQVSAEVLVAEANLRAAEARAGLAQRELERRRQLEERGFISDDQYEEALAQSLSATAAKEVSEAELTRARASLEAAQVQLSYTEIRAEWSGPGEVRYVAERFVDAGDRVGVNDPLFRMVSLDPVLAQLHVTEVDFSRLRVGDAVRLRVDAFPGEVFVGEVVRIAPVFSEQSRQVRVEVRVNNPNGQLRPGMFARAELVLEERESVQLVPEEALVRRNGGNGVFITEGEPLVARWVPVETGILENGMLEIVSPELSGSVIILGQQLVEDGTPVRARERILSTSEQ